MLYSTAWATNAVNFAGISAMLLSLFLMLNPSPAFTLTEYVKKTESDFAWHAVPKTEGFDEIHLVSQKWHGSTWQHDITITSPARPMHPETMILVITGDRVDAADQIFAKKLAARANIAVATLFNVPNQPLFDKREDELIAHSFEKYLEGEGEDWPLPLPMTASAIRAMDAVQQWSKGRVKHFVVSGASKRGWTTWLAAATRDPRIVGIAPVAFDNLNFAAQLKHQVETWGHLSEMLEAYASGGLTGKAGSEGGRKLIGLVDPYSYLDQINVPVLIVRGSNDRYWSFDSSKLYWDRIRAPKNLLMLPNEGHDFQDETVYIATLSDFAAAAAHGKVLPSGPDASAREIWGAGSDTLDFRDRAFRLLFRTKASDPMPELSGFPLLGKHSAYLVQRIGPEHHVTTDDILVR